MIQSDNQHLYLYTYRILDTNCVVSSTDRFRIKQLRAEIILTL